MYWGRHFSLSGVLVCAHTHTHACAHALLTWGKLHPRAVNVTTFTLLVSGGATGIQTSAGLTTEPRAFPLNRVREQRVESRRWGSVFHGFAVAHIKVRPLKCYHCIKMVSLHTFKSNVTVHSTVSPAHHSPSWGAPVAYGRGIGWAAGRWLRPAAWCVYMAGLKVSHHPPLLRSESKQTQLTHFPSLMHQIKDWCPRLLSVRNDKGGLQLSSEVPSHGSQDCNCIWGNQVHKELQGD